MSTDILEWPIHRGPVLLDSLNVTPLAATITSALLAVMPTFKYQVLRVLYSTSTEEARVTMRAIYLSSQGIGEAGAQELVRNRLQGPVALVSRLKDVWGHLVDAVVRPPR